MRDHRFICTEVFLTYPDISERIRDIVPRTLSVHRSLDWQLISKFITEGNLIYVISDLNISGGLKERIVAVAFYSFSETLFDGFVCSEDIFADEKYKNHFFDKLFWKEAKDRITFRRVSKIICRRLQSKNDLRKEEYSTSFVRVLETPRNE